LGIAVQNFNGGVLIDEHGFTGVEGLFAAGEVSGGVHGSDRPGGNNLSDTQVFGFRAGRNAAAYADGHKFRGTVPEIVTGTLSAESEELKTIKESESLYYREMTIVRRREGMEKVLSFIDEKEKGSISTQLKNRLITGRLLAKAILTREESRGTHYREDRPDTIESWRRRIVLKKGTDGLPEEVKEEQ
jgi:fumarate reductase (CoM/CoB) subunit A